MAKNATPYTPYGCLRVLADTSYTSDDITASANIVVLDRGVRITDEDGNSTPIRGVRVLVEVTGLTAPVSSPAPDNVPMIWHEGDELNFSANGTYTFLDSGLVSYGAKVV